MDAATFPSADALRGFRVVAEACAEALVNEPSEQVVGDLARVAHALGDNRFDGVPATDELRQRYYDRFFVSASPFYVPLVEGSVRAGARDGDRMVYGPVASAHADHVLGCYRAVGFDYQGIAGFDLAVGALKPDSLASELAFMAFLARAAADAAEADPAASARAAELLCQFAREHAVCWFGKAAECLRLAGDDFYARVCALAAEAAESLDAA